MALCTATQRALNKQGCLVQMTNGPGMYPRSHFHSGVELIFVHAGGALISSNGVSITALPGSVIVIPGESEHSTQPIHKQFRRTVVHAANDLYQMQAKSKEHGHERFSVELSADAFDRCFWAARQLHGLTLSENQALSRVLKSLLNLICAELDTARESESQNPPYDAIVSAIVAYMNAHLDRPEELPELSRRFDISERHLGRLFGSQLGYSPQRYWLNLRLERACQMLGSGAQIPDVAEQVGFESVRGFQRAFSRLYGVSPTHYRK